MAKVKYLIINESAGVRVIQRLVKKGLVASVRLKGETIVARYGVNKTTLTKLLKKSQQETASTLRGSQEGGEI